MAWIALRMLTGDRSPYIVPKTSLTGANTERVDTRVVQVINAIDANHPLVRDKRILVGQLLDVFIDTQASRSNAYSNAMVQK